MQPMAQDKIKILFTIPNFDTAGSGKVVYDLVKNLDRSVFEPEICCYHNRGAFFKEIENRQDIPKGFYLGPVLGFGRNLLNEHFTTTLAAEPGYMFETRKSFTIVLGIQLGASYFHYDSQPNKWVLHWGPKVTFGFWVPGKITK